MVTALGYYDQATDSILNLKIGLWVLLSGQNGYLACVELGFNLCALYKEGMVGDYSLSTRKTEAELSGM